MKKRLLFSGFLFLLAAFSYSQGCSTIRNIPGFSQYLQTSGFSQNCQSGNDSSSTWVFNINNRYYKSFREFIGTKDLNTLEQDESVNKSYTMDLSATHLLKYGWSLSLAIPILANSREASKEHGGPGTTRHTTKAYGMGDIRFIAAKWLLKCKDNRKGNIQLGLGLKLPTGDYEYKDYFYRNDSTKVLAPVNPGIQLGDGGLGIITEMYAYYKLNERIYFYTDLYYLTNPREQNGVSVLSGNSPTPIQIKAGLPETSVTDAYALSAGAIINLVEDVSVLAGIRYEGVPVYDLIGGSGGTRRPGYNFSVEPGITYSFNKVSLYARAPITVSRSIKQDVPSKIISEITGVQTHRPGGSADYQLFFGISFTL